MAETLQARLERLRKLRDAGIASVSVDGIATSFDRTAIASAVRQANRALAAENGLPDPRPIASTIKLT